MFESRNVIHSYAICVPPINFESKFFWQNGEGFAVADRRFSGTNSPVFPFPSYWGIAALTCRSLSFSVRCFPVVVAGLWPKCDHDDGRRMKGGVREKRKGSKMRIRMRRYIRSQCGEGDIYDTWSRSVWLLSALQQYLGNDHCEYMVCHCKYLADVLSCALSCSSASFRFGVV
jgi:hypothetical protein